MAGHDGVTVEMLKDSAEMLVPNYEELFNKIFGFHEELTDINKGLIIPISKPHKPKTTENMRPITILKTTKKKIFINNIRKNKKGNRWSSSTSTISLSGKQINSKKCLHIEGFAKSMDDFKRNHFVLSVDMSKTFYTVS